MTISYTAPVAEPSAVASRPPTHGAAPPEAWFARLARFSARRRGRVMLAWLAVTLVAGPLALHAQRGDVGRRVGGARLDRAAGA